MSQDQNPLEEVLHKLNALDARLGDINCRLTALEKKAPASNSMPPEASLETFEAEVDITAGVIEEEDVRKSFAASETAPDTPESEPPPLPPSSPSSKQKMPSMPVPPAPAAPTVSNTADATELAASARTRTSFAESIPSKDFPRPKARAPKESLEVRIASVWLPWIGLLFLALAAGFLAREYARGPIGKVVFSYIVSFALIIVGLWKERKYTRWARPVLAGGLAFTYFTSYAMGFVEPMRLLDNLSVKLAVLAVNLALMFGVAQWKRSEVIAGTALVLGYITTGVVGDDMAAFSSSLALSLAALVFLWLNRWFVATAIAAAATYVAHLYVWQAMPGIGRTQTELFWFHGLYLSLYFLVYTAAGLVGRTPARADVGKESQLHRENPAADWSRYDILAAMTQVNVGAYLAGMIALLKLTEVYWHQAWLFFLPMTIVFGGLGLLFGGLRAVQNIYLTAAIVSLTLGIAALLSPMWLPVFMCFQALALLVAAARSPVQKGYAVWQWLSLASLAVALLYVGTGGRIDLLRLSTNLDYITFPWWTIAGATIFALGYSWLWEKRFMENTIPIASMVPGGVALAAAMIWNMLYQLYPSPNSVTAWSFAVPVVAIALVFARSHWQSFFLLLAAPATLVHLWQLGNDVRATLYVPFVSGLAGFAAGMLVEKRGTGSWEWDRWIWRGLYIWGQLMVMTYLVSRTNQEQLVLLSAVAFALTLLLGWLLRSAALAKSAYLAIPFVVAGLPMLNTSNYSAGMAIFATGLLLACAYPLATSAWQQRTGDRHSLINRWGQAAVVFAAGIIMWQVADLLGWNKVLVTSAWAFTAAVFAAGGLFPVVVWVVLAYMVIAAFSLVALAADVWSGGAKNLQLTATTLACVIGVILLVAAERVLRLTTELLHGSTGRGRWLSDEHAVLLTGTVAISTLVMAIISLRLMPDLQNFYFTGAIVGSAFVWIVFGFWFNESAYRKSGFAVLCLGLVKGLIWDLWSLKETIYRVISGAVIGILAIAASFLYTRFRGRVSSGEE